MRDFVQVVSVQLSCSIIYLLISDVTLLSRCVIQLELKSGGNFAWLFVICGDNFGGGCLNKESIQPYFFSAIEDVKWEYRIIKNLQVIKFE